MKNQTENQPTTEELKNRTAKVAMDALEKIDAEYADLGLVPNAKIEYEMNEKGEKSEKGVSDEN